MAAALALLSGVAIAQGPPGSGSVSVPAGPILIPQPAVDNSTYQSSVSDGKVTPGVLPLSLNDAIQRGLKFNLGLILTSQNTLSARGARLEQLQALLPTVERVSKRSGDGDGSAGAGTAHSWISGDHRAVRLYRHSRIAELVAGELVVAGKLPGAAAQL